MIFLWILLALSMALLVLLCIALVRTFSIKPTSAACASFPDSDLERAQNYAQTLSALIQCETVSTANETSRRKYSAFHKQLRAQFPALHKAATRTVLNGSLLYKIPGQDGGIGAPILLMSHHDVVPATQEWKHAPFSGEIAEGSVWGRGTVDAKGNLFCFMQAVEELLQQGWQPECDVYLASSCTAEWNGDGAPATAAYFKEHRIHLGLLLDEGGMIMDSPLAGTKGRYGMVGVVEKSYADVKFTANAAGGDAGIPGSNTALVQLARFISHMDKHNPFHAHFSPTLREMLLRLAPNMKFGMRFLMTNLWLFEPLLCFVLPRTDPLVNAMMRTTCAFTTAEGSSSCNVLPRQACVTANVRCMPHQNTQESIAILCEIAKKFGLTSEVLKSDPACAQESHETEAFCLLEEMMQKIYPGYGVAPYIMPGSTDARFYMHEGVVDHALRFAPLEINKQQYASTHSSDENLSIMALPPAVDFYREFLTAYCARNGKPDLAPEKPAKKSPTRKKAPARKKTDSPAQTERINDSQKSTSTPEKEKEPSSAQTQQSESNIESVAPSVPESETHEPAQTPAPANQPAVSES